MGSALALIISAIIGAVATQDAGVTAANESKAAGEQSLGLANIQRQDVLAANKTSEQLQREQLGISRQQLGLGKMNLAENQRQFNTTMNQNAIQNVFKTIGDAATKSATFKNYLLQRAGV